MPDPRMAFRNPTPRARGFRLPAEWERHEATVMAWPHDDSTWKGCLEEAERAVADFATAVGRHETVHLLVPDAAIQERAEWCLNVTGAKGVAVHRIPYADAWVRDTGPLVVVQGRGRSRQRLALDFRFNTWGEKYPELLDDDQIPQRLKKVLGLRTERSRFVLEGGSIDVNGKGTLLTTEQCLLNANRNPQFTRAEIERHLREYLGVTHILWLGGGITGDDTDGHVDDVARFVDPHTVVCVLPKDRRHPDFKALHDNHRRLKSMADQDGEPLRVIPLPAPRPVRWPAHSRGKRLPASYANFLIANRTVCVPVFQQPADTVALRTLGRLFPRRKVVPIDARHLVAGFGALHCMSCHIPA